MTNRVISISGVQGTGKLAFLATHTSTAGSSATSRSLPELVRVQPRSCHVLHPRCTEWSLRRSRGGSATIDAGRETCSYETRGRHDRVVIAAQQIDGSGRLRASL